MENVRPHRKILRSPSVKRKNKALPVNQRVQLQRVLGVTVSSNAGLSCDSNNGTIAYPAGCVVVLFNPRRNKQSHIFNATKKTITALAFSRDGKHLITGETGHQPAVRVWDVAEKTQVAEFRGHKFGINCVAFSPNMKEVVSVGTQHDMMINVWNWKTGNKVASNKVSSKVSALAFSEDGKCFVTVGNRHVRFWYLEDRRSKINQTVPLMGRSGILGDQKDNFFCGVVAGQGSMCGRFFVITQSGLLCEFNEKRQLDKWVELRTKSANCITAGLEHIFVGCSEGVVRVFCATTLHFLCSLPKPHHLGVEVTTATNPSHMVSNSEDAKYPDTKAIAMDDDHKKVTCIYNDRSVYIWDVHDIKRVGKAWSFLYHSGCIWSLEVYPPLDEKCKAMLPPGSFLTASGDDTIRVWNLNTHMPENTAYKRNIYSNELLKIVYVDPTLTSLCNVDYNPAGATDKTDTTYDGKNGVRSIRVSPDGADLASGDRQGNIRIYDMQYLNEKRCVEAHESDVMCLEYSYTNYGHFLATSSRDRLIHVFDVDQNYGLVQTLGDHSSSITAVRFTDTENKLRMISCGADKSILLRNAVTSPDFQFQLEHHLATKITLYDMVIDPTQKSLATACQDRNVRLYNIQTTKEKKCYRGSVGDEGVLLRIHLDPSGTYAATTCTDKNVCILDFQTGELMATMYGHSEVITGVKFANDLKHVITVSADGCIFVWRLPSEMTNQIKGRLLELGKTMKDADYFRSDQPLMPNPVMLDGSEFDGNFPVVKSASVGNIPMFDDESVDGREDGDEGDNEDDGFNDGASHASLDYRFSIGQLPNWAKAKFGDTHSEGSESSLEQVQPRGRWAQRVDHTVEFKSQLDLTSEEDTSTDRRRTAEASVSQLSELRRETVVLGKQLGNKNLPQVGDDLRGSTGDLRSSLPATPRIKAIDISRKSDTFSQFKSDTSLNLSTASGKRWSDRFDLIKSNSLEFDDTDDLDTGSDTTEVIYPPADLDSDLFASTYKIYAVDDVKSGKGRSSQANVSNQDDASVSTDTVSQEDDDDPNDDTLAISNPTTPSDPDKEFLVENPDKEDFVRENFEEDTFTPIPLEKFTKSVDKLERQVTDGASGSNFESTPFSPRLSLSARFMSRAQPSGFKNFSSSQITYRQDNWYSRNKMEMTRAMDETRKSLLAMNMRSDSAESNSPEKEEPPSPPTKLEEEKVKFPNGDQTSPSYATSPPTVFVSPPWGYCSKNLRRLWATFTLSQESITEETTLAHASRATARHKILTVPDPQVNRPALQPRPPHQLFQSRIPTPKSSPRPCRARRIVQSSNVTKQACSFTISGKTVFSHSNSTSQNNSTLSPLTESGALNSSRNRSSSESTTSSSSRNRSSSESTASSSSRNKSSNENGTLSSHRNRTSSESAASSSSKNRPSTSPASRNGATHIENSNSGATNGSQERCLGCKAKAKRNLSKGRTPSRSPSCHKDRATGGDVESSRRRHSKDSVSKTQGQTRGHSPARTTQPTISSQISSKPQPERQRRRSSNKPPEQSSEPKASEVSETTHVPPPGPKFAPRTRPTYFKPTQSSKNKTSRTSTEGVQSTHAADKTPGLSLKKVRDRGRLSGSKLAMYASTPNLISGLENGDDEQEEKSPRPSVKFTSTSNLRLLSDLSRSVPDVNDTESSTDSSSGGSGPSRQPRRASAQGRSGLRFSVAPTDVNLMPPPQSIPASSSRALSSQNTTATFSQGPQPPRRKSSTSELTLDQAKSILLGKSGVLVTTNKPSEGTSASTGGAGRSGREMRESASSGRSSISTLTAGNSPPVFDNDLAHTSPAQLAVAEEIQQTANMLRHQKQANISSAFSPERLHSQPPSNLEASPLDLPERDQPNRRYSSPKQPPPSSSSSSLSHKSTPPKVAMGTTQPFHASLQPRTSPANNTFVISTDHKEEDLDVVFTEGRDGDEDETPHSVRDRIARFQPQNPRTGASIRTSSPYRRILPVSPNVAAIDPDNRESPRSQSDTGVGSESSDADTPVHGNTTAVYTTGTKNLPGASSSNTSVQKADRSRLALSLSPSSSSSSPVSLTYCQSVLDSYRSQLNALKDLFAQVDGRTDENAQQVLMLLGEVFHETKEIISDMAMKTPGSHQRNTDSAPLNSQPHQPSSVPQGSTDKTFQSSTLKSDNQTDPAVTPPELSEKKESMGQLSPSTENLALLSATKDMLQPLLPQLSQDLSEGILRLIRERVDEQF